MEQASTSTAAEKPSLSTGAHRFLIRRLAELFNIRILLYQLAGSPPFACKGIEALLRAVAFSMMKD
jgi:hypothetical protein